MAVNMVGDASHIHSAAPGGPRYRDMSTEERTHITNAIWLCATHNRMVDGDTVTFSVDDLLAMKLEREAVCKTEMIRQNDAADDLIAIGPDVIGVGVWQGYRDDTWTVRISHFVYGDLHALTSYIGRFTQLGELDRYVLVNALGEGRILAGAPSVSLNSGSLTIQCPVAPGFPRFDARSLGTSLALHEDAHDLMLDESGNIALVSGVDALSQHLKTNLSFVKNESPFHPGYGSRFAEYHMLFQGSAWLERLLKLDAIRLAAIPYFDERKKSRYTPLLCVERVHSIEILADAPIGRWLPVRLDLEVKGLGRWQRQMSVCVPEALPAHQHPI